MLMFSFLIFLGVGYETYAGIFHRMLDGDGTCLILSKKCTYAAESAKAMHPLECKGRAFDTRSEKRRRCHLFPHAFSALRRTRKAERGRFDLTIASGKL